MTTTLTITSGQASFTAQGYTILPSPGTAVPDNLASTILAAAYTAGVVLSSSAGTGTVIVPSRRFYSSTAGAPSSGAWLLGDEVVDSTGAQFECTAAGSPGTWVSSSGGGGGGAVSSVAGKTGAVTLVKGDVGLGNVDNTADVNKPVSTAQATADALAMQKSANGSDVQSASAFRTALGLGSAATQPTSAFDAAGAATALLASPALTGTPTINGKAAKAQKFHNTLNPYASFGQYSSGRVTCGVDATLGKVWSYNSSGLYQVDALTSTAWSALTLPTNINPSGQAAKVVTYTPPSGANSGVKQMFLLSWNTSTSRYEIYSAAPGLKTVSPTWSSLLQQFQANAILIPTAFRACSTGIFAGEYTGTPDVSGSVKVYRSVDGITWTTVLSLTAGTGGVRHIHGIYEDPYNLGTIYVQIGDFFSPYTPPFSLYKSTDGGATFTGVSTLTSSAWQAVAMGFTADYIWCLSDQSQGAGPFLLDRATMTPKWATTKSRQDNIAVPMGIGGRQITDAVFNSTTTVTSATASFTSRDVGCAVMGNNAIPLGAYIVSVTNSTTIVLNSAATSTASAQTLIIGGDQFYAVAYGGAIDSATGYLYAVANDASNFGNVAGIFVLFGPDEPFTLLRTLPLAAIGNHEVFIAGGYLWVDRYGPMPLLTAV